MGVVVRQDMRFVRTMVAVASLSLVLVVLSATTVQAVRVPHTLSHRAAATAAPVVPGFAIDHLGVLWEEIGPANDHANGASHGAVRFRHDGVWGAWIPLIKDGAPGEGLWASGLVAGGGAEAFQVRGIPVGAGSPRTVSFNTSDGPLRTTGLTTGGAAAADNCLSRAEWGADESLRTREAPDFFDAQVMTLHHTATGNDDPDPAGTVRAIYEYHTVDNGWRDIGYNYLVSEDGQVFEGRWSGALGDTWDPEGSNPDTYSAACAAGGTGADFAHQSTAADAPVARGAHTAGFNTGNLGVALIGSFNDKGRYKGEPTAAAVSAAEHLLAELAERHGIDPQGSVDYVNDENAATVQAISGHRDYNATECPGDRLYDLLPQIRSNVAALLSPTDSPPTVSITSPADGSTVSGTVAVTADASDDNGVTNVEVIVDGASIATDTNGSDGWSVSWDSASAPDGVRTISVTATDSANQTGSDSVSVSVDNATSTGSTMHIDDLDETSTSQGRTWTATVTASVADSDRSGVSGASVTGTWGNGDTTGCTTDTVGACQVELSGITKRTAFVDFSVTNVTLGDTAVTYAPSQNTDPDGDSDGTTIRVVKP